MGHTAAAVVANDTSDTSSRMGPSLSAPLPGPSPKPPPSPKASEKSRLSSPKSLLSALPGVSTRRRWEGTASPVSPLPAEVLRRWAPPVLLAVGGRESEDARPWCRGGSKMVLLLLSLSTLKEAEEDSEPVEQKGEEDMGLGRFAVLKRVLVALHTLPPLLRRRATCFSDASARISFSCDTCTKKRESEHRKVKVD